MFVILFQDQPAMFAVNPKRFTVFRSLWLVSHCCPLRNQFRRSFSAVSMNLSRLFHCSVIKVLKSFLLLLATFISYHSFKRLSTTFLFFVFAVFCDSSIMLSHVQAFVNSFFEFLLNALHSMSHFQIYSFVCRRPATAIKYYHQPIWLSTFFYMFFSFVFVLLYIDSFYWFSYYI